MVLLRLPSGYAKKCIGVIACAILMNKKKDLIVFAIRICNKKHWFYFVCHPDKEKNIGYVASAIRIRKKNIGSIAFAIRIGKKTWFFIAFAIRIKYPDRRDRR